MKPKSKPRVLCVDDESQILEGLSLHLQRHYELTTATSGRAALELLAKAPGVAVIISDMRMPVMDGATFLARAREIAPEAVRMLLTGQTDIDSAIAAINDGQIFRFLTKPCPPTSLVAAVAAAVEQHRLVTAERVLLAETLHGSIKALTDVLALVSPTAFGRANRIKLLVKQLVEKLAIRDKWQVEVAAMLSQLATMTLPAETAEKLYHARPLSAEEHALVARLPTFTEELLGNIPRLEGVREILKAYPKALPTDLAAEADAHKRLVAEGAQLLRLAVDFDAVESYDGGSARLAVDTLRGRTGQYAPEMLQALAKLRGAEAPTEVRELSLGELHLGMVLAEDVVMKNGALLVARGHEVCERFLERLRYYPSEAMRKATWRVFVHARDDAA